MKKTEKVEAIERLRVDRPRGILQTRIPGMNTNGRTWWETDGRMLWDNDLGSLGEALDLVNSMGAIYVAESALPELIARFPKQVEKCLKRNSQLELCAGYSPFGKFDDLSPEAEDARACILELGGYAVLDYAATLLDQWNAIPNDKGGH